MKIIFLDFDGVLNSHNYLHAATKAEDWRSRSDQQLDSVAVARLQRIVEATGARIVISSTWRKLEPLPQLWDYLRKKGMRAFVVGATPWTSGRRGLEIDEWLKAVGGSKIVEAFVILDDDGDMDPHKKRLVQTSFEYGLCDEHVGAAIKMLHTPWEE